MKILLINPPTRTWTAPNCFPQGLGYIAQVLRKDHDLQILDLNVIRPKEGPIADVVTNYVDPDIDAVGITGLITNYRYVISLIKALKWYFPNAPIVVGGPLGSSIPEIMLRKARADFCCVGEGEFTARELFRELEWAAHFESVKEVEIQGIAYLYGDDFILTEPRFPIKDINALPLPAYDLFPTEVYAKNPVGSTINKAKWQGGQASEDVPKSMNILPTRGCPWNCFFCYHDYMGVKYRPRDGPSLISEIEYLQNNYGVDFFLMASDCFVVKKDIVTEFCAMAESWSNWHRPFQWEASARVDTVDHALLKTMKRAGCQMVCYGVESGSQAMLDRLNKRTTVEQAEKAVRWTQEIFGHADCSFIVGTPGETKQTIQESIDFCKRTNLTPQAVFYLCPYPATPMWEWMRSQGYFKTIDEEEEWVLKLSDHEQGEDPLVNFTELPDEELVEECQRFKQETGAWNK